MNHTSPVLHERRYKVTLHLIFLAVTLAAGVAMFLLVLMPARSQQVMIQARNAELDRLIAQSNGDRQQHAQLRELVAQLDQQQEQLFARIPEAPREADYLALVTEAANGVGLHVKDYRPGPVARSQPFSEMTIQLSANGSFEAICEFIHRLENARRLSSIASLQIGDDASDLGYPMEITVVLYFGRTVPARQESNHG